MTLGSLIDKLERPHASRPWADAIATAVLAEGETVDSALPKLVGVTGYARHGKDTVGKRFEEQGFVRFAFADALKSMALALDPFIDPHGDERLSEAVQDIGWERAKTFPEVRRFLQVLGTEGVRDHLGDDSWVRALEKSVAKAGAQRVVVTDVRFPNEAAWIHSRGGKLIRVVRLNPDGSEFDNGVSKEHASEKYVADLPADALLEARDLETLQSQADAAAAQFLFGDG
jgi:hypothetical protein